MKSTLVKRMVGAFFLLIAAYFSLVMYMDMVDRPNQKRWDMWPFALIVVVSVTIGAPLAIKGKWE